MPSSDWIASGGAFKLLIGVWLGSAILFSWVGVWAGKALRSPNDGCLFMICNVVLAGFGGAIGLLALSKHYPTFILSSSLGAVLFPAVGTYLLLRSALKRR